MATGAGSAAARTAPAGQAEPGSRSEPEPRGVRGSLVVTLATVTVIAVAVVEVVTNERVGPWTGATLVAVSVISPMVTRAGDRSLPAMMPPLAFLAAALVAGQALLPDSGSLWTRELLMLVDVLGTNAPWVVIATVLSTLIAGIRHLLDRRGRRPTP